MVEYALILALVAVICLGSIFYLGKSTTRSLRLVASAVGGTDVNAEPVNDPGETHNLAELIQPRPSLASRIRDSRAELGVICSIILNVILWTLLMARRRREHAEREAEREAEQLARRSPEELLHRKRRQILRLLEGGFGDFIHDRIAVRSVMTQEITVCHPSDSTKVILEKMHEERLRSIVVCDDANRLVGIIARSDLPFGSKGQVREFMTPDPISVRPDMSLSEAIKVVTEQGITSLPVTTGDGTICGLVPIVDVVLILQCVQLALHNHRDELSKVFFCKRKATSISDVIAGMLSDGQPPGAPGSTATNETAGVS